MALVRELAAQAWAGYGCHGGTVCHGVRVRNAVSFSHPSHCVDAGGAETHFNWNLRMSSAQRRLVMTRHDSSTHKKPLGPAGVVSILAPGRCGRCAEDQELHLRKTDPWSLAAQPGVVEKLSQNVPKITDKITKAHCLSTLPQNIPKPIIIIHWLRQGQDACSGLESEHPLQDVRQGLRPIGCSWGINMDKQSHSL